MAPRSLRWRQCWCGRRRAGLYAAEFGAQIAGSRVETIPEYGHIPQVEKSAETLALVREFLEEPAT